MNRDPIRTADELNTLHDRAREDALALRRQALADLWRGADALWADATQGAARTARRFEASLRRHRRLRTAQDACPSV